MHAVVDRALALGMFGIALALSLRLAPAGAVALPPIDEIGFEPPPGATLPADARFLDEYGRRVRLGDYLGSHPALVVPAYYDCSKLCGVVLSGLAASLDIARLAAGRDVEIVVVSISPLDAPPGALTKKRDVLGKASGSADGWHFLTGDEAAIGAVTGALGYRYRYEAGEKQYAHATGVAVVSPGGRVASVLYGVAFDRDALRRAIAAADAPQPALASASSVGTWLLCLHYDPLTGRYSFAAMSAVRAGALLTLLALAGYIVRTRRREAARPKPRAESPR